MKKPAFKLLAVAALAMCAVGANAADANVTNNVIVGNGVTNGGFTVGTASNIEIGLRARERYVDPVAGVYSPTNDTNSNGAGTYNHSPGGFTAGAGATGNAGGGLASWNFDWSINTNQSGSTTNATNVDSYKYLLSLDYNPGAGTQFLSFDLVNGLNPSNSQFLWDHSFGTNSTNQSAGAEAANAGAYATLKSSNNLVQNSWNYGFFSAGFPSGFDPNANGTYTIRLEAFALNDTSGVALSSSQINVNVGAAAVPEPGSLALVGLALGGLAFARKRKTAK